MKEKVEPPLPNEGGGLDEACGAKLKLKPEVGGDVTPFGGDVTEGWFDGNTDVFPNNEGVVLPNAGALVCNPNVGFDSAGACDPNGGFESVDGGSPKIGFDSGAPNEGVIEVVGKYDFSTGF